MAKYYLDTEFIEGYRKSLLGKPRHFIDLISIGIVAEDGREYSAICSDFNYKEANLWVRDKVITPLYTSTVHGFMRDSNPIEKFHRYYGRSREVIAKEILDFIYAGERVDFHIDIRGKKRADRVFSTIEFNAYYADYDWVLFCSLFGTMADLPVGFPMYCRDLKQTLDERAERIAFLRNITPHNALQGIKNLEDYPKNNNEHSAIADARFNKKLHKFLQTL